jgi:hypothetical protein
MKETKLSSPVLDETIPHQAGFPSFKGTGIKMEPPFVNKHGVIIGDSKYNSENSPLNHWSEDTDPAVMSGDEWVHPTNDIGWIAPENQELLEKERSPKQSNNDDVFMHPERGIND